MFEVKVLNMGFRIIIDGEDITQKMKAQSVESVTCTNESSYVIIKCYPDIITYPKGE